MVAKPTPGGVSGNITDINAKTADKPNMITHEMADKILTEALEHLATSKVKLQAAAVAGLDLILQTGDVRVLERMYKAIEEDGLTRFNAFKEWVRLYAPITVDTLEVEGKNTTKWRLNKDAVEDKTEKRDEAAAKKWWTTNNEIITVDMDVTEVGKRYISVAKTMRNEERYRLTPEAVAQLDKLDKAVKAILKVAA